MPPLPAAGVPLNVPVPLPLSTNVTPAGKTPLNVIAGGGKPLVVTVNDPAAPARNVAPAALVIAGASFTINMNVCVASGGTPFVAVNVRTCTPPVPAAGVPLKVPVLLSNVTPRGSAPPVCVMPGVGVPTAVTVNERGTPTVKVVVVALVKVGPPITVSVNLWTTDPLPLAAVNVSA